MPLAWISCEDLHIYPVSLAYPPSANPVFTQTLWHSLIECIRDHCSSHEYKFLLNAEYTSRERVGGARTRTTSVGSVVKEHVHAHILIICDSKNGAQKQQERWSRTHSMCNVQQILYSNSIYLYLPVFLVNYELVLFQYIYFSVQTFTFHSDINTYIFIRRNNLNFII